MEYMLLIYSDPEGFDKLSPSQQAEGMAAFTEKRPPVWKQM